MTREGSRYTIVEAVKDGLAFGAREANDLAETLVACERAKHRYNLAAAWTFWPPCVALVLYVLVQVLVFDRGGRPYTHAENVVFATLGIIVAGLEALYAVLRLPVERRHRRAVAAMRRNPDFGKGGEGVHVYRCRGRIRAPSPYSVCLGSGRDAVRARHRVLRGAQRAFGACATCGHHHAVATCRPAWGSVAVERSHA